MNQHEPSPPAFFRWLLEQTLPPDLKSEALLGDLHEEYLRAVGERAYRIGEIEAQPGTDKVGFGIGRLGIDQAVGERARIE